MDDDIPISQLQSPTPSSNLRGSAGRSDSDQLVQPVPTLDEDEQTAQHAREITDAPRDRAGGRRLRVVDDVEG